MVGRIPVIDVMPVVDSGRLPAKATVGEPFPVSATVFREGHDLLGAEVVLTGPDGVRRPPVRLQTMPPVDRHTVDRHRAWVTPDQPGAWSFEIYAWSDPIATWQHDAGIKIRAGVDVELMFTEGRLLFERVLAGGGAHAAGQLTAAEVTVLRGAMRAATDTKSPVEARLAQLESPELSAVLLAHPLRELVTIDGPYPAYADRSRALFSSWYEFFPRSEGAFRDPKKGTVVSGTFATAAKRLDAVAAMGFDVIYLPPIHPIGEVNRKGPNNTLTPGPNDPGSPWAIGSRLGGHDAVNPDLGTLADFDAFVAHATSVGLEVALDLALQCAPDHPWATSHPEWFTTRADGTIAYAENPPKKYQDIYPLNFDNVVRRLAEPADVERGAGGAHHRLRDAQRLAGQRCGGEPEQLGVARHVVGLPLGLGDVLDHLGRQVQQSDEQLVARRPVDGGVVDLGEQPHVAVLEALDEPDLPERLRSVERLRHEPAHEVRQPRVPPGAGIAVWRTWLWMSKSGSSTQMGWCRPKGTWARRRRNGGARCSRPS